MKYNKFIFGLLVFILAMFFAACQHNPHSDSPITTIPVTTTNTSAPATTVPPTTTTPIDAHTELSPEYIVEILYEAGELFDAGETIVLNYNSFTDYYASSSKLGHLGMVDVVKNEAITIHCDADASKEDGIKERIQYLYAIAKLIELHPDCYYIKQLGLNADYRYLFNVFCQYKKVGCDSLEEYLALDAEKIESGNYTYHFDGRTDFCFDTHEGIMVCDVLDIIDSSHRETDSFFIFAINDESLTTLYEAYINGNSEG